MDLATFQERRKTLWDKLNENFGFNKKSHLCFGVFWNYESWVTNLVFMLFGQCHSITSNFMIEKNDQKSSWILDHMPAFGDFFGPFFDHMACFLLSRECKFWIIRHASFLANPFFSDITQRSKLNWFRIRISQKGININFSHNDNLF